MGCRVVIGSLRKARASFPHGGEANSVQISTTNCTTSTHRSYSCWGLCQAWKVATENLYSTVGRRSQRWLCQPTLLETRVLSERLLTHMSSTIVSLFQLRFNLPPIIYIQICLGSTNIKDAPHLKSTFDWPLQVQSVHIHILYVVRLKRQSTSLLRNPACLIYVLRIPQNGVECSETGRYTHKNSNILLLIRAYWKYGSKRAL